MKSYRKELWFNVPTRRAFINITPQVEQCLRDSGVKEGLALVNAMHITASVFINDDESGLHEDYERWLEGLAPHEPLSRALAGPCAAPQVRRSVTPATLTAPADAFLEDLSRRAFRYFWEQADPQ